MATAPVAPRDEAVAIVDPYTSGRFLVDELAHRGWPMVAVRSSLTVREGLLGTWNPGPFEHIVVHRNDASETAEALRRLPGMRLRAVVAGSEPGVELADELAEIMGLRGNGTALSLCRRDKFCMHEHLRESGLRSCAQRRCASPEEAKAFAKELGSWPLVAKPCASTGTDSVFLCDSPAALTGAVEAVLASRDAVGRVNKTALVQEFLEGAEYAVDCVSLDGRHLVAGMWVQQRRRLEGTRMSILDSTATLPYDANGDAEGGAQRLLRDYVFKCLTALGVRNGASHSEVIVNETHGPCLVEMGARMHCTVGPALWKECAGEQQAQPFLVADVFTNNGVEISRKLDAVAAGGPAYELAKHALQLDLHCSKGGYLAESIHHAVGSWIRALPTYWASRFFIEEGDHVEPTWDMSSSPGIIILVGPDAAAVQRDADRIRERERGSSMYIVKARRNSLVVPALQRGEARRNTLPPRSFQAEDSRARPVSLCAAPKLRELEGQVSCLLSPMASPAQSPLLSPMQDPMLPPELGDLDDMDLGEPAFMLNGFESHENLQALAAEAIERGIGNHGGGGRAAD